MKQSNTIPIIQKRYGITLIGEILVDEINNRSNGQVSVVFGGSPANITMNMSNLGIANVRFFGSVGNDFYGKSLLRDLNNEKVDTSNIMVHDVPTTIVRINKTDLTPIPTFYRGADSEIEFTKELEDAIINSSILHFSYWPLSKEPSLSTILKAIKVAKEHGTLVGLDPNYHDALVTPESISIEELRELLKEIDIIKPSLDDATRIFGEGYSVEEYLLKFVELGVSFVVMTLGKDGLVAYYADHIYRLSSYATEVVDATGAGDAFIGGLYTGILQQETIETILKIGTACSACNLAHVGARSYLPVIDVLKEKFHIGE